MRKVRGRACGCSKDFISSICGKLQAIAERMPRDVSELALLCYFDAVGYANRRIGKTPRDLFPALLARSLAAVTAFNRTREELKLALGHATVVEGDAEGSNYR